MAPAAETRYVEPAAEAEYVLLQPAENGWLAEASESRCRCWVGVRWARKLPRSVERSEAAGGGLHVSNSFLSSALLVSASVSTPREV